MAVILVTGMSGVGKSTALVELARRGHRVVDTDYGGYSEDVPLPDGSGVEQLWREERISALLDEHPSGHLFISGCVANQVRFYPRFDAVVLLSAPLDVILERVDTRVSNDFGKTDADRARIIADQLTIEPKLRGGSDTMIDTRAPVSEVADELEAIAASAG